MFCAIFVLYTLLDVWWVSWIYGFTDFIKFRNLIPAFPYFYRFIFLTPFLPLLLLGLELHIYRQLDTVLQVTELLIFGYISLCTWLLRVSPAKFSEFFATSLVSTRDKTNARYWNLALFHSLFCLVTKSCLTLLWLHGL